MKSVACFSLFAAMLAAPLAAEDRKPKPAPQALTIPADAVEAGESTWKYTDKDGKKWIYRKSPFGVVRVEDVPESEKPKVAGSEERTKSWKVTDLGDKVSFENASPFGPQKWTRKKSELTEDEKYAYEKKRGSASSMSAAAKPAKGETKK
ncbi:MAG: hypothetical protein ABI823_01710 [Bryobacteraceae bacterium]